MMNSISAGFRNIVLHRGPYVSRTIAATVVPKRDIHKKNVVFKDKVNNQAAKEEACETVVDFVDLTGLKVEHADIFGGGFHSGSRDGKGDLFNRLTTTFKDENAAQMFFHRPSDDTYWNRMHVPKKSKENEALWAIINEYFKKGIPLYVRITEEEYQAGLKRKRESEGGNKDGNKDGDKGGNKGGDKGGKGGSQ